MEQLSFCGMGTTYEITVSVIFILIVLAVSLVMAGLIRGKK